ncbi:MAG TPA: hypothetical protein VF103_01020 [Polyangiaceae bacterium]
MVRGALTKIGAVLLGVCGVGCHAGEDLERGAAEAGAGTGGAGGTSSGGGQGGGTQRMPLEQIASGEDSPYRLAIDDRYVFWIAGNQVRRAPLAGGEVSTLATGEGLARLAVASGFVYFTDLLGGRLARVDREGGRVEELGSGVYPDGLSVGEDAVYWANSGRTDGDGTLAMVSLDGATGSIVADGLYGPSGVVVDGDTVFFSSTAVSCGASSSGGSGCSGGGVARVPLGGGVPVPVDTEGTPRDVVAGARGIYWMLEAGRVKFAPRGGGDVETLAELFGESQGPIAVDDDFFYMSSSENGRVLKIPLDGGEPLRLAVDLGTTGGIAVAADWVYVAATSEGRVLRVAKDGSAARPTDPVTGPCPNPVGSAEALAKTPREDANLELLALTLDAGEVVATDETYERVVADIASLRALAPDLADISYRAPNDGKTLLLVPTELALASMRAGEYSAWDCLNDFYGLVSPPEVSERVVVLELEGMVAIDEVASVYAELPGVEQAQPNGFFGDGPTICGFRDGTNYEYVVDRRGGDCPAGCTTNEAHRFRSTGAGVVEALEVWESATGASRPDWYTRACGR